MDKCVFIAEIGHNWRRFSEIEALVKEVSLVGADYAKIQLYDVDKIKKPGDTNYEDLKRSQLTYDDASVFVDWCSLYGIKPLASVFDQDRAEFWKSLGMNEVKLASRTVDNVSLRAWCTKNFDTVYSSIATHNQGRMLTSTARRFAPNEKLLFVKSRREILGDGFNGLPEDFHLYDGFSDHTIGLKYPFMAIAEGCKVLEKHVSLDLNGPGWDQPGSATPDMVKDITNFIRDTHNAKEQESGRN